MKRVLVTGATGFIGAAATAALRARGFAVHAIGRTPPLGDEVTFHYADLLNIETMRAAVARAQASHLLHLAWDVTPGRYWSALNNVDWVSASLSLLTAFSAAGGRRAVFAGTCAEYQWGTSRFFETETPCLPASLYGTAKNALHQLVEAYGESTGLSVGWGRIFFPYGPGETPGRLVSGAILALLDGLSFPTTHGRQRRDFLHVEDVAGAFAALVDCELRGPVNIGSGKAVAVQEILDIIARKTGHAECLQFGARILPESEPLIIEADITRLTQEIGYRSRYDLVAGLADAVAWWRGRAERAPR